MKNKGVLSVNVDKRIINIPLTSILYILMDGNNAHIHVNGNKSYITRMTLAEIEEKVGANFIKVKRGCLVSVLAIHSITDKVNLINGENLDFAQRNKKDILELFHNKQEGIIRYFNEFVEFTSDEEYHEYYKLFDRLPIAFCDIEMVFDEEFAAVDWIFRYANQALADIEKIPLESIIGHTFYTLFPNMDLKWLRSYERAVLFNETIKIIDYSPEINTYLDIICFPTFKGHCGCILFDITKINSYRHATDAEKAMTTFFVKLMNAE